jgi:DNA repair exonuclease SbcCD nuclease subunit
LDEGAVIKIVHTSDWQIGKLFGQFESDDAALLADARFQTVEKIAMLAHDRKADAVLVAGDVFDAQGVADKTIHRLFNAMAAYDGPWILIPGNHDAALTESVWTRAQRLRTVPKNVHLCLTPEVLLMPDLGIAVLPAPLTQRNTYVDLTEWFDNAQTPAGLLRIGMAHGSVQGLLAEGIDSPNPIAAGRATRARLDYLAMGDWHGMRQVDARTWYSGTPETDRFRANDSAQSLWVELAGPGDEPVVTPVSTGIYRWRMEHLTLQVASDADAAVQAIAAFAASDVVSLTLSGHVDLQQHRRLEQAVEQARGRARSVLADFSGLKLLPTDDDIDALQADGYLGDVIAELRASQDGPDGEVARDALALLAGMLDTPPAGMRSGEAG